MRGEPGHLNSKKDYEYLRANYPKSVWKPVYQSLYDDRLQQFNRGALADGEAGIVDDTHSVVEMQDEGADVGVVRYQYETAVNPDAWMYRVGFTDEEVLAILNAKGGE